MAMEESIQDYSVDELEGLFEESTVEMERIAQETMVELERTTEETMVEMVRILGGPWSDTSDSEADLLPDYFGTFMLDFRESHSAPTPPSEDKDGAGDDLLSQFKTSHYNGDVDDGEETDICCICLERLHHGLVATLHCRHEFHGDCIGRWLHRGQNFCPLCNARAFR